MTSDVLQALHDAATRAHPQEACGILLAEDGLGQGARITQMVETANVHPAPETHFEIDPQALVDAHRAERSGGAAIAGYFHSHPNGPPRPSQTDQDMASGDAKIWAIVGEEEVGFWRDMPGGFEVLSYLVSTD